VTQFANVDLLTIPPNRVLVRGVEVARAVEGMTSPTGNVVRTTTDAPSSSAFTHEWVCETRADLNTLTDFLDTRVGRLVHCWIPTYQRDLIVSAVLFGEVWQVPQGSGLRDIVDLVTNHAGWGFWFSQSPTGGYRATDRRLATDIGGGYATLGYGGIGTVGAGNPALTTADGGLFSRLMFCRMAEDTYRVQYVAKASIVTASFVEVAGDLT
jgi:hypothetical protein